MVYGGVDGGVVARLHLPESHQHRHHDCRTPGLDWCYLLVRYISPCLTKLFSPSPMCNMWQAGGPALMGRQQYSKVKISGWQLTVGAGERVGYLVSVGSRPAATATVGTACEKYYTIEKSATASINKKHELRSHLIYSYILLNNTDRMIICCR